MDLLSLFTENGDGAYGLLGASSVNGVFATYCSGFGECLNYGHDYFNFSTSGELPESEFVTCGFTTGVEGRFAYWKNCPSGDNVPKNAVLDTILRNSLKSQC